MVTFFDIFLPHVPIEKIEAMVCILTAIGLLTSDQPVVYRLMERHEDLLVFLEYIEIHCEHVLNVICNTAASPIMRKRWCDVGIIQAILGMIAADLRVLESADRRRRESIKPEVANIAKAEAMELATSCKTAQNNLMLASKAFHRCVRKEEHEPELLDIATFDLFSSIICQTEGMSAFYAMKILSDFVVGSSAIQVIPS